MDDVPAKYYFEVLRKNSGTKSRHVTAQGIAKRSPALRKKILMQPCMGGTNSRYAKEMKRNNEPINKIILYTGLSENEIEKLKG